jgi:HK97 family phage major capsid protein
MTKEELLKLFNEDEAKGVAAIIDFVFSEVKSGVSLEDLDNKIKELDLEEKLKAIQDRIEDAKSEGIESKLLADIKKAVSDGTFKTGKRVSFETKEATPMTTVSTGAQTAGLTGVRRMSGINALPVYISDLYNTLVKGYIAEGTVEWVNEGTLEGDFAWVGENALKPYLSTTWSKEVASPKTISGLAKGSVKMAHEWSSFWRVFQNIMVTRLNKKLEHDLLFGDGVGDNLRGITLDFAAYNNPVLAGTVSSPNLVNAINAAADQIRFAGFIPSVVVVSTQDMASLKYIKDDNGRDMYSELSSQLSWAKIIEVDIPEMVGNIAVFDDRYWEVYEHMRLNVQVADQNDDDFEKNMMTMRVEMMLYSFHSSIYNLSGVYASIAAILASIEKQ